MAGHWRSQAVAIQVPRAVLEAMWRRARGAFDAARGGRYDARTASTLLLWSGPLQTRGSHPIGSIAVRWGTSSATIREISWRADHAGREAQIWRAIEVLAGADWPVIRAAAQPAGTAHSEAA